MPKNAHFGSFPVKNYPKEPFGGWLRVNFCRRAAGTPSRAKGKAEAVMAAFSMSNVADAEHALSLYRSNARFSRLVASSGFVAGAAKAALVHGVWLFSLGCRRP
jgi:hypothetical protein